MSFICQFFEQFAETIYLRIIYAFHLGPSIYYPQVNPQPRWMAVALLAPFSAHAESRQSLPGRAFRGGAPEREKRRRQRKRRMREKRRGEGEQGKTDRGGKVGFRPGGSGRPSRSAKGTSQCNPGIGRAITQKLVPAWRSILMGGLFS
jgi:hypothetical protein